MKKILCLSLILFSLFTLLSCSSNKEDNISYSGLIGTFTYDTILNKNKIDEELRIYNDKTTIQNENMYTSNVYPLNTVNGIKVSYTYQQSLKLIRNYTYNYTYTIILTNAEQWGKDFAKIEVDISGNFTYQANDETFYQVSLEQPTSGNYRIYGSSISSEANIFAWAIMTSPSYELNIKYANEEEKNHRLISSRIVEVEKYDDERILTDNIYYYDILEDIAPYCEYQF